MNARYFGTDGIRGRVGVPPLTPPHLLRFAIAAAQHLVLNPKAGDRVVIGTDTRASGAAIADVMAAGIATLGLDVVPVGILPTPALALATRHHGACFGIMVTASHNLASDNGIKLFGSDGFKLPTGDEAAIEAKLDTLKALPVVPMSDIGTVAPDPSIDVRARYTDMIISSLPDATPLRGMSLVVDGAHGAAFDVAPYLLRRLGADVVTMGTDPNGQNINDQVGSTHPAALARKVRAAGAYAGVALDGDGDRLIMVDEHGTEVDGDQLIGLLAGTLNRAGQLAGNTVVTTVMSNLGLERHLRESGIAMPRTPVGDKYVVEHMREGGFILGGEQSGHIVMMAHGTTGDGLLAAAQVLAEAARDGRPFSEVARVFEPAPQKLVNIRFDGANPLDDERVQSAISQTLEELGETGRLVVRKSGTEPKIRIMAEALSEADMEAALQRVVSTVEAVLARRAPA